MIDERYDRDIQLARAELGKDLKLIGEAVGEAFRSLTRIQFDTPWENLRRPTPTKRARHA